MLATAYLPPDELAPIAKAADELGYHTLALRRPRAQPRGTHHRVPLYRGRGSRRWEPFTPWVDPIVAIGTLGAVTERLPFFTNIYVLPMRNPFPVAKAVATASAFTGGRVSLGIGMGWCEEEFDLLDAQFRKHGAHADEMIEVLAKLWSGEWVEHHGQFYDFPVSR